MPNLSDSIRSTLTEDGRIILHIHRGQILSVNVVGSKILDLLEQGWDEQRVAEEISKVYLAPIEVVIPDVREFVDALRKHEIIQPPFESIPKK